ncbi:GNAT family N-acetyltransferase [Nocardia nepalensis]|uniref:GNAT family N-acetyltransferase n=1 Tax=Nocardia nepalensis TaxID=3375448 RepID=UPI003B682707
MSITRVADGQWHAVDEDLGRVVGRTDAEHRPDGRLFVSIDAWHDAVFDRLAEVLVAELPAPLYTVVDEADADLTECWRRAGFTVGRRELEYLVPTDLRVTGLGEALPPSGVAIVPAGEVDEGLLRAVDRAVRAEVEATLGWQSMPAEVIARSEDGVIGDLSMYAVAAAPDRYLGLIRVEAVNQPRIGLVAVRAGEQRRGIARALLAHALGTLHRSGVAEVWLEVHESNQPALALLEGLGVRSGSSNVELVR